MYKIDFPVLEECLTAIAGLKQLRLAYMPRAEVSIGKDLFLIGETGILTRQRQILTFHRRYLAELKPFNDVIIKMNAEFEKFGESERDAGRIDRLSHKRTVLAICDLAEELGTLLREYLTRSTIVQFYNVTFQSDTLFYWIQNMFDPRTWEDLPEQAKSDVNEGARALLTNVPTGASFLFLRAMEGYLRKLCNRLGYTGTPETQTLGGLLPFLKVHFSYDKPGADLEIERQLDYLSYIKDEFRNPAAHPEKSFSQREAEQLFHMVIVSLDRIRLLHDKTTALEADTTGSE